MKTAKHDDDRDILAAEANHPSMGIFRFERVSQDRRTYYRIVGTETGQGGATLTRTGSLTTAKGARETIAYWNTKGWIK